MCNRPRISNFFKRIPSWVSKWTKTNSKHWPLSWPKTSSLKRSGTLTQQLIKLTVETALNAEMDEHLGYEKHAPQGRGTGNNRNGYSTKRLKGQHGEVTIQAPRDRNSSFEPQFVRKGQSRLTQMDDQILALYARA